MKVLVTGATGFIGSWLARRLLSENADVTVLVKSCDPIGLGNLEDVKDKMKIVYGDIRKAEDVERAVKGNEVVFHLAAITQVLYSIKNPRETFDVNAMGTLNVLEAIRKNNENAFLVLASTDKVYGEPLYLPIDEDHPVLGKSPYDASKIAADRMAYSYNVTYGIGSSIVRCSNIYGGADSNMLRAVPDFSYSLLNNRPPVIRGHGNHERDFLYVDDAVRGYMSIAQRQKTANGKIFNFGTSKKTTVKELAEVMLRIAGVDKAPVVLNQSHKGEIEKQYLSYEQARKLLGWEPQISLEEGLGKTLAWYRENTWWRDVIENVSKFYCLN